MAEKVLNDFSETCCVASVAVCLLLKLPAGNHASPAGALVFELRERGHDIFARIDCVIQSPSQVRRPHGSDTPFRLRVRGTACHGSELCDMSLQDFTDFVGKTIDISDRLFVSSCGKEKQQACQ